ncbi:MAG: SusC/RagA family TonB-linked outer membrane protein [Bacteroidales bacterium]|nr:SusC/RagA family TonB-linked outer membrane protein [Bacteroidales bacterium]
MKKLVSIILLLLPLSLKAGQAEPDTIFSATVITRDQMNKGLVTDGLGALNGKAAGVTISSGAERGAMLNAVRVRGTTSLTGGNDPLVVIDGVTSDLQTLSTLFPGDIESFTILKDASETSQFGSRGASGVIVVNTVKGRGGKFSISYDVTGGVEAACKNLKMLSADEFRKWNNEHGYVWRDGGTSTDWPSVPIRVGYVQKHHIALSGGTQESNYRASVSIMDRNTILKTDKRQNYTAKVDLSQKMFDNLLSFDLGLYGALQRNSLMEDLWKLFYSSATFNPTFPAGKVNGSYPSLPSSSQISNPSALMDKKYDTDNANFNVHVEATANILKSLKLSLFGAYTYSVSDNARFYPTYVSSGGEAHRGRTRYQELLGNVNLDYNQAFDIHEVKLNAFAEIQKTINDGSSSTTKDLTTNALGYYSLQAGATRPWDGTRSYYEDMSLFSVMMGGSYKLASRYILNANLRTDASSLFGVNHRWGFFPSVSATWLASKEEWLKSVNWLSNLSFNVGYGQSGNQGALGAYYSRKLFMPTEVIPYEGASAVAMGLVRNDNPDLKWEVRSSVNAGVESSFFSHRLIFNASYYYSMTKDMLYEYEVGVPPFAYNRLMANLGRMSNMGVELGLVGVPLKTKDMELNINMNLTWQKNKLISLSGYYQGQYLAAPDKSSINSMSGAGFHGGNTDVVYQIVGQPLGVFYLPHCIGLGEYENGERYYILEDLNKDGIAEAGGDRYIAGQATPKVMLGSNISFRYKNFDVSVQVNGAFGHKIFNGTSLTYMNIGSLPYYNVLAQAPARGINDQVVTDYWLENGDYVNIDYITLGWNIPVQRIRFIKNLRISASVNNVATITGYSGLTPMINSSFAGSTFGLDDKISYPVYRSYSLNLSIQF